MLEKKCSPISLRPIFKASTFYFTIITSKIEIKEIGED